MVLQGAAEISCAVMGVDVLSWSYALGGLANTGSVFNDISSSCNSGNGKLMGLGNIGQ